MAGRDCTSSNLLMRLQLSWGIEKNQPIKTDTFDSTKPHTQIIFVVFEKNYQILVLFSFYQTVYFENAIW